MSVIVPDYHSYRVAEGHGLRHDPFGSLIAPRPIGWISSQSAMGVPNLAPYSFFNAFSYTPPIIGFTSIGWKDTAQNISETGEFVWNLATRHLSEQMNLSSVEAPGEVNEFVHAGLEMAASEEVAAPRVGAALAAMECRHTQTVRLTNLSGGETDSWLIFGQVIVVHIHRDLIHNDVVRTELAEPLGRGGGKDYFVASDASRLSLQRPRWPNN
ncbi:MAG: flavin reductase family protein [Geoalkalibacter sp.]|uniref:flavin reductase family protein n=1 Tax=Geoalkalibacter sp. TaxID=3041440 RepID=UPI003D09A5BF